MGYEQALLVRDGTHFAILFSCLVSLIFIVVWFVDLSRLQCSLTRPPDKQGPPAFGWEGVEQCTMEFVGILVFFANFRDCLRMVSNYDNERQDVLRRKAETFNNLRDHCVVALQQAQENASRLREMLFDMMETKVREHIGSVMLNLLPTLWSTACRLPEEEQQQFVATMRELLEQLSANLDEPGQLAVEMMYEILEVSNSFDHAGLNLEAGTSGSWIELKSYARDLLKQRMLTISSNQASVCSFAVDDEQPKRCCCPGRTSSSNSSSSSRAVCSLPASVFPAEAQMKKMKPEQRVLLPVRLVLDWFSDHLHVPFAPGPAAQAQQSSRHFWFGCGRPPWQQDRCCNWTYCVPRLFSLPLGYFCCCCGRCCPQSFEYPKRVSLGCFWMEIYSKLHERLITGLWISLMYCSAYFTMVGTLLEYGCPHEDQPYLSLNCWFRVVRKLASCLAFAFYVPCIMVCLYHIQRLDAVMTVIADIQHLEDMKKEIEGFSFQIRSERDRQVLLQALKDRVFGRMDVVTNFTTYVLQPGVRENPQEMWDGLKALVQCLRDVGEDLGDPSIWMSLTEEERREPVARLRAAAAAFDCTNSHFCLAMPCSTSFREVSLPSPAPHQALPAPVAESEEPVSTTGLQVEGAPPRSPSRRKQLRQWARSLFVARPPPEQVSLRASRAGDDGDDSRGA